MTFPVATKEALAASGSNMSPTRRGSGIKRPKAWPFALPAFIALALVLLFPLIYNVWISLHVDQLSERDGEFVWFENYTKVFQNGALMATLGRTLTFTFGSLVLQFIVGLGAALALESFPKASRIIRPLLLTPWVMPGVAVAAIWLAILNPISGLANLLLGIVGLDPVQWLSTPFLAMTSLIVVNTWKSVPYWMLMLSAGIKTVPKEAIEAAKVDGAPYWRIVWHIVLPAIRPVLGTTTLLAFIWTFNYFDLAYLLTNGGPGTATTTLPFAIWESALKFNRFDQAAAYSVLSIALTGIAIGFYLRATRKQEAS